MRVRVCDINITRPPLRFNKIFNLVFVIYDVYMLEAIAIFITCSLPYYVYTTRVNPHNISARDLEFYFARYNKHKCGSVRTWDV